MIVKSITMISDFELNRIREILETAENPEEELYNHFPYAFHHIKGDVIYFGAHSYDYSYEIYIKKEAQ